MKTAGITLTIIVFLVSVAAGCGGSDDTSDAAGNEISAQAAPGSPPKKLVINDLKIGTGAEAQRGDTVAIHYVATGYDSKEIFETTRDNGQLFSLPVAGGQSVGVLDKGIEGMRVGGRRELIAPARLVYDTEAAVYVVDLVRIE